MMVDLQEDKMYRDYLKSLQKGPEEEMSDVNVVGMTQKEIEHEFNTLDLSSYNDKTSK